MIFFNIFNNISFYILVTLVVSFYLLKNLQKFPFVNKDNNDFNMFKALDNFYIKDIFFIYFSIIFYFCFSFLIFVIICINNLGSSNDIFLVKFTFLNCLHAICILLSIQYYFKILNLIFYPYIIKLHFYFTQYGFYQKMSNIISSNFAITNQLFYPIYNFFYIITCPYEDFIQHYKSDLHFLKLKKQHNKKHKLYWKFKLYLNYFCKKNAFYFFLFNQMKNLFHFFYAYSSSFLYYLPHTCLILIIFLDIHKGLIYYTYYMLLIYYISNIIKKVRNFYHVKDPVYDMFLADYFYKNVIPYYQIKNILTTSTNMEQLEIYQNDYVNCIRESKEELTNYILNDFQVYYIIDKIRANNNKYLKNRVKRIHILVLILLLNVYILYHYNKYIIIIYSIIEIKLIFITLPMMLLLYYIHSKILYDIENTEVFIEWVERKNYRRFFKIILLFFIIPILYIILKNKIIEIPNEILFQISDYFTIMEIQSLETIKNSQKI